MESAAGFRFYPTEEELISFYLHHKLEGPRPELDRVIPRVDIYAFEPWLLPSMAGERCKDDREQWFFFMPQQEREARGGRPNRTTGSGYWKATGSPGYVYSSQHRVIGLKKTMVFYKGKAPSGKKTKWKLNEYKAIKLEDHPSSSIATPKLRHEMSVCRVYVSSGSARVFDRRPSGTVATINTITRTTPSYQQARIPGGDINEADTTSLHKTPAMAVEFEKSSCSTVSSNSGGDHGHGSMPEDISFYGDLQTLGNWDHLNWP